MTALNHLRRGGRRERFSYRAIRRAVGWIGILLPFVLMAGTWILCGESIQPSVSHYYYTCMGNVFVGAICAVAFFLFFYSGPSRIDDWLANIAGLAALGLAFFPTTHGTGEDNATGSIHLICAGVFFVCLACFSLFLFPRSSRKSIRHSHTRLHLFSLLKSQILVPCSLFNPTRRKRNRIYVVCGCIMVVCLVHIVIFMRLGRDENSQLISGQRLLPWFHLGFRGLLKVVYFLIINNFFLFAFYFCQRTGLVSRRSNDATRFLCIAQRKQAKKV
ncbi:MAG: hypothetical protein V2A54_16440 [Bacteroidota bacterium]